MDLSSPVTSSQWDTLSWRNLVHMVTLYQSYTFPGLSFLSEALT